MKRIRRFFRAIHRLAVTSIEMRVIDLMTAGNNKRAVTALLTAITFNFITPEDAEGIQKRTGLKI
jgi:hypothetical protein